MAWSVLQSASNVSTSGSGVSATFTSNVSSGTKIIAAITQSGNVAVSSVKDGAGNTLTQIGTVANGSTMHVYLYAMDTPAGDVGTKPTITVNPASSTTQGWGMLVQEVSGLLAGNTTAMVDGTLASSTETWTTGTFGPPTYSSTASNEYLVYVYGDDGGPITWTVPSGYTGDANGINNNTAQGDIQIAYANSTGGTESGAWSLSGSSAQIGLLMVAFQLAAGGGSTAVPVPVNTQFSPSFRIRYRHKPFGPVPRQPAISPPPTNVLYQQTFPGQIAITGGKQNFISKIISGVTAVTASAGRFISRTLTAVLAVLNVLVRTVKPAAFSAQVTVTATITAVRQRIAVLITSLAVTVSTQRMIGRVLAGTVAVTATLQRVLSKSISGVTSITGTTVRNVLRVISATITASASAVTQKLKLITLTTLTVVNSAVTRQIGRPLTAVVTVSSVMARMISRTLTAQQAVSAALTAIKAKFLTLVASVTTVAAMARKVQVTESSVVSVSSVIASNIRKTITSVMVVTGTVSRNIGRTVTGVVAVTSSIVTTKVKQVFLTATVAANSFITRKVSPVISSSVIMFSGTTRRIARTIQGNLISAGQTARIITRVVTGNITVTAVLLSSKVHIIAVSTIMSVSSTVKRTVAVTQSAQITVTGVISRFIKRTLSSVMVFFSTLAAGRPFKVTLVASVTVPVSVTAKLLQTSIILVFKYGVITGNWIIGQIKSAWKTGP